jgi:hypothetical protein
VENGGQPGSGLLFGKAFEFLGENMSRASFRLSFALASFHGLGCGKLRPRFGSVRRAAQEHKVC